jgi:hypothetical protein
MPYDQYGTWYEGAVPQPQFPQNLQPQFFGQQTWPEVGVVAGTVVGEAGREPQMGQAAVVDVLNNRAQDPYFSNLYGSTMTNQALAGNGAQFNTWMAGDPTNTRAISVQEFISDPAFAANPQEKLSRLDPAFRQQVENALWAQRGVMGTGELSGIAEGAQYYVNPQTMSANQVGIHQNLGLGGGMEIGRHEFYGQGANGYYEPQGNVYPYTNQQFNTAMYGVQNPYTGFNSGYGGYNTPKEMGGTYTYDPWGQALDPAWQGSNSTFNSINQIIPQINSSSSFTDPATGRSFTTGDGSGFNGVKNGVPVDMYGNPMPGYSAGGDQYAKGGNTGSLVYQTDGSYQPQGQQSYGNNEYGYGGTYNPSSYGYGGTDYSTGNPQNATTAIQNAQYMSTGAGGFTVGDGSGFKGYNSAGIPVDQYDNPMPGFGGQPDITVYANPQPRDQFGQAMGGDMGSTLYSATAELGGGLTMADAARQNAAFESVFSSGAQDHMFYEGQLNNLTANNGWTDTNVFQPQQINGYTYQPQIATTTWGVNNPTVNQNISNLNPSNQLSYDPWSTQYQPY